MLKFLIRRVLTMVLTALCLTFVVFYLTNLPPNLEKLAKSEASARMSDEDVDSWIERNGYAQPVVLRYGEWLGIMPGWTRTEDGVTTGRCIDRGQDPASAPVRCGILQGDWGFSTVFKSPVSTIISDRLAATGWLMLCVMLVMVPTSLLIGVLSGMREGSRLDRGLSIFSIASTATPEYVSGVVLIALFASSTTGLSPLLKEWGLISGNTLFMGTATSAMERITFWNFALPVMTIALYGIGYIARMTRASMTEVMTAQYIRTARLKGVRLPHHRDAPRPAQRADRTIHGDHAAVSLVAERRGDRRNAVQLQGLRLDPGPGRGQQRHRTAARLLGCGRGRGAGDPVDFRHRLRLPESPHPYLLRSPPWTHFPGARSSPAWPGSSWPVWVALLVTLGLSLRFKRRLGLYGKLYDSPVGMIGFGMVLFWVFTAAFAHADHDP